MTTPNIVTYSNPNATPKCVGYVVLPSGEYWGVRFDGQTEEVVRVKALRVWAQEQAKWAKLEPETVATPRKSAHHFVGKVWMINRIIHDLKRVEQSEVAGYEAMGYQRGGPRSK